MGVPWVLVTLISPMRHPWEWWLKSVPWVTHGSFDYFQSIAAQPTNSLVQ